MIRYIDEHKDQFGVEAICRVLRPAVRGFITSRGYRAAKTRPPSARALQDELLVPEITPLAEVLAALRARSDAVIAAYEKYHDKGFEIIGISADNTKGVVAILSRLLADEHVLYTRLRNYHWNVVGPRFHSLHEFFEEM